MIKGDWANGSGESSLADRQSAESTELSAPSPRSEILWANRLWIGGFVLTMAVHWIWSAANQMPPIWDMAHHQFMGWLHLASLKQGTFLADLSGISSYYPPLYYLLEAAVLWIAGPTNYLSWFTNLPWLLLLSYFTYRTALYICRPVSAAAAGILVLLLPLVAWTSRETLLDPALAGMVSLALFLIMNSRFLQSKGWTLVLGFVIAAGMLTKWTFAVFLAVPVLYSLYRSSDKGRSLRNLLDAFLIALPIAFWWYLPNLDSLWQRSRLTAIAATWEEDPGLSSIWGWIYYPRSLSSYYFQLILTLALVWAAYLLLRKPLRSAESFLIWTVAGGMLVLTVLEAKDPRYVMPLASPIVVLIVGAYDAWKGWRWTAGILVIALVQFFLISFPILPVSGKVAFFGRENDTDYLGMGKEWVLFSTDYFGVLGPPRVEDWHHLEIARHFENGSRVGFVPDAVRFNPAALRLAAMEEGIEPRIHRIGDQADFLEELETLEWLVGKTGEQGISYITQFNEQVYDAVEARNWRLVEKWNLPDGTEALLWQNPTLSP